MTERLRSVIGMTKPAAAASYREWLKAHELTLMYALIAILVIGGFALIQHTSKQSTQRICDASKANRTALVGQIEQVTNLGKSAAAGAPESPQLTAYLARLEKYRSDSLAELPPLGKDCETK